MALELLTPFTRVELEMEKKIAIASRLVSWEGILILFIMLI